MRVGNTGWYRIVVVVVVLLLALSSVHGLAEYLSPDVRADKRVPRLVPLLVLFEENRCENTRGLAYNCFSHRVKMTGFMVQDFDTSVTVVSRRE